MSRKFLELYSGNRDRQSYPLVSEFTVPFGAVNQNISPDQARDPVVDGAVYYTFTLAPRTLPDYTGNYQPGSGTSSALLDPNQSPTYSLMDNFYVGYTFIDVDSDVSRLVRSYNAATGQVTFDYPFPNPPAPNAEYIMYAGFPTKTTIFIPAVDDNGNVILNSEQAYTGYYVVFETDFPAPAGYSNPDNSNIFFRQISYYDRTTQLAYFDEPLPFDFSTVTTPQLFTLRKSLPSSRWSCAAATYLANKPAANPVIGPLPGHYIITLPTGASETDNFYKGKYAYFYNNTPEFYSPPLPSPASQQVPIPYVFYPIYGCYYIQAYNGTTRQLSVKPDPLVPNQFPTFVDTSYTAGSFVAATGMQSITEAGGEYTGLFAPIPPGQLPDYLAAMVLNPDLFELNKAYDIEFTVKKSPAVTTCSFQFNGKVPYNSSVLSDTYTTYKFRITLGEYPASIIFYSDYDPASPGEKSVTWNFFRMTLADSINICNFLRDNFSPLDYNGTMVGLNQTVCYDLSLVSLSLPNLPLLTGSKVSFYPYIYVEFNNVTSPTAHGTNVFYSNHPESARALFTAAVYPAPNPNEQTFMAISGSMQQLVKFKPNDSLHIRIYLPNGELFVPILQDLFTPYEPLTRLQVQAVFSLGRSVHTDK